MVALVATRSATGRPFMTPLWFVADGATLVIATGAESWTSRNVSRHPEMALLFSGEGAGRTDRVLRLRGTATCYRGLPSWRVLLRMVAKYYLSPRALRVELRRIRRWRLRTRYYGQATGGPGHLRVVPTRAEFLSRADERGTRRGSRAERRVAPPRDRSSTGAVPQSQLSALPG
jgi:hypothetical protein